MATKEATKKRAPKKQDGRRVRVMFSWDLPTAAARIAEGLSTEVLEDLQRDLELTNQELADLVLISPRTLTRRKREQRLPTDESDRAYRLGRLFELATEVLGDKTEARTWMKEPNYALGDKTPLEMVRTEPGATLVERVLGQIEYGLPV